MAFLGKARKEDLIILARDLGEEVTPDLKIIDLRNLIVASTNYEIEFVKGLLNTVISQRTEEAEQRKPLLDIRIGDIHGRVCADTGATRSIAGELMFNSLRERGVDFQKMEVTMALADGSRTTMKSYTAPVSIDIEGRTVLIEMLALPKAKGNRTLLGTDFLEKSGIVLNLKNKRWYFSDKTHHRICFKEDLNINSLQTAGSSIANSCNLREDEGTPLTPEQIEKMSYLLEKFDSDLTVRARTMAFSSSHWDPSDKISPCVAS
ncbi:hypothetical protein AVEN_69362-1 [Araneus ventricosus]|uniref:Peptidase A2 domain-containing protein n=1 Tax=Araneus ventricosus TaxID=182803 RepID=A0A4Y2JXL4_ARAVE|nr:hypothetical protein AVEN_69362-1 [Araneus ventricosus]